MDVYATDGTKLLSAIIRNRATSDFRDLDPAMFVDDDERSAYNYIRNHHRQYGEFPQTPTVAEQVGFILPVPREPVAFYVEQFRYRYIRTQVTPIYNEARDHVVARQWTEFAETSRRAAGLVERFLAPAAQEHLDGTSLAERLVASYEATEALRGDLAGIPTGWGFLDRETNGYQDSDLILWVARTKIGKTWLLLYQALAAHRAGKSILFVSMEMSLKQIGNRYTALMAGLNPTCISRGMMSYFGRQRLMRAYEILAETEGLNFIAGNFNKTPDKVDEAIQEYGPDAVYIDGLYLMKPSAKSGSGRMGRYEAAAYVMDEIKAVSLRRDRPIIATTQYSRAAGKNGREGDLESIGYTDAAATHASIVVAAKYGTGVPQDIYCAPEEDGSEAGDRERIGTRRIYPTRVLEVQKGREGESGSYQIKFSLCPPDMSEIPFVGLEAAPGTRTPGGDPPDTSFMQ